MKFFLVACGVPAALFQSILPEQLRCIALGAIVVRTKNFTLYVPLVSSIVLSLVVTLLLNVFKR